MMYVIDILERAKGFEPSTPTLAIERLAKRSGVPGVIRTRDPRFHTTSVFTAAGWRSWSGLSLRRDLGEAVGAARLVSTPSSLRRLGSGLVWRLPAETFPDFERIHRGVSDLSAQF